MTLQQNKILRVIKKNLVKKCLEMLAEIAELKGDYVESYEQLGKSLKLGVHENSTVGAKIAELLRLNDSAPEDEQLSLKEYVDRMKGKLDVYSIVGESIAVVSPSAPQEQYTDKTVDVPGVRQGQVLTSQAVQKTVEVPQVQFLDRVLDASVVTQRHVPQETIDIPVSHVMEKIIEVTVSRVMEKIIEGVKPIPKERVLNSTVEQIVDVPIPQIAEETVEVSDVFTQGRVQQRIVEQSTETPAISFADEIAQTPKTQTQEDQSEFLEV